MLNCSRTTVDGIFPCLLLASMKMDFLGNIGEKKKEIQQELYYPKLFHLLIVLKKCVSEMFFL